MSKKFIISLLSAAAILISGSVFAADGPDAPASVPDPIGDPEKQAKTEEMLKAAEGGISGDQGGEISSKTPQPIPDPEKQKKTEEMLKDAEGGIQGR